MSLEYYRDFLKEKLSSGKAFQGANAGETMHAVGHWWILYKEWEKRDTFLTAFNEGRMTVRQIPVPKDLKEAPINQIKDYELGYGDYKGKSADIAFGIRRGEIEKQMYPNERYRVGTNALKQRLDPSNFGMDKGERLKYANGLHDLSASLCVPTVPNLTQQLRWKWGELEVRVTMFMPLAKPGDMEVFYLLNSEAKKLRNTVPQIYLEVSNMRRRMTRVKLADSEDIGAGLRDVSAPGSDSPKIRYGMKGDLVDGKLAGIDKVRAEKALNYTSILSTANAPPKKAPRWGGAASGTTMTSNEVVIAYREHAGDRFPLFTKFDMQAKAFICHPDEPGSKWIVNQRIPNTWAQTQEI